MHLYIASSHDPYYNLAVENWLFREVFTGEPILYLWQNTPCVVIGRAQNPWRECNIHALNKDNIPIVRRQSGGGTVFHDMGNINYTIISSSEDYNKRKNLDTIIQVLAEAGIKAHISERNDILLRHQNNDYKISGSAFRETKDRAFQHGTLLVNTNTDKLYHYLHHKIDDNLNTKGVHSHRSKVMNLKAVHPDIDINTIIQAFLNNFNKHITYLPSDLTHNSIIQEILMLQTWQWRYGKTLPFERSFDIEGDEVSLQIKNGHIHALDAKEQYHMLATWIHQHKPIYDQTSFQKVLCSFEPASNKLAKIFFDVIPNVFKVSDYADTK